jgi:hypothetical protein
MTALIYACLIIILFYILLFETVTIKIEYRQNSLYILINFVFLALNLTVGGKNKKRKKEKRRKSRTIPIKAILGAILFALKRAKIKINRLWFKANSTDNFDAAWDFGKGALLLSLILPILRSFSYLTDIEKGAVGPKEETNIDIGIKTLFVFLLFSLVKALIAITLARIPKGRKYNFGNTGI